LVGCLHIRRYLSGVIYSNDLVNSELSIKLQVILSL